MAGTRDLPPPAPAGVDFSEQVEPILRDRCYACHGANVQMNGLRLDERSHALKGGDSGLPSVIPGDSARSLLIRTVAGLDPDLIMPKTGDRLSSRGDRPAPGLDRLRCSTTAESARFQSGGGRKGSLVISSR